MIIFYWLWKSRKEIDEPADVARFGAAEFIVECAVFVSVLAWVTA